MTGYCLSDHSPMFHYCAYIASICLDTAHIVWLMHNIQLMPGYCLQCLPTYFFATAHNVWLLPMFYLQPWYPDSARLQPILPSYIMFRCLMPVFGQYTLTSQAIRHNDNHKDFTQTITIPNVSLP